MKCTVTIVVLLVAILGTQVARYFIRPAAPTPDWHAELKDKLPTLGQHNWIVIADSAFPLQSKEGITTTYIGGDPLTAVHDVLALLAQQKHVKPSVFLNKELDFVDEKDVPAVLNFRAKIGDEIKSLPKESLPHDGIMTKLDDASKNFSVLVLKTDSTIPYSSVFINLDSAYWDDEKEAKLKKAMKEK
ncbi:MAG TPA: hypothetical protein VKX17_16280 [Planctomycetota bacterium]|nr:hypothetical protein [Planctomycetota bacterium]